MSLFSRLRARILQPHHRTDPRLHEESEIADDWSHRSTAKHLSDSDKRWIDSVVDQASIFPLDCFIRFEYLPEQQTISCHRVERMDQPRLDLGVIRDIETEQWKHFWRFLYDHFNGSLKLEPLTGEIRREFVVWASPRHTWDPYSLTPNAVVIKLCIQHPSKSDYETPWCGLDGPCTAHDDFH